MTSITYSVHADEIPEPEIQAVESLLAVCFDPEPGLDFGALVGTKHRPGLVLARADALPVGFKIGYESGGDAFYSWLGGVHPEFRRRGIARTLLERQHAWCRSRGYAAVTTEAVNHNRAMLLLNLSRGFVIKGTRADRRGLKILLERDLDDET